MPRVTSCVPRPRGQHVGRARDLILDEVEVAVVPGEAFGPSGFIRLSYALADDDLVEGVGRIQELLSEAR